MPAQPDARRHRTSRPAVRRGPAVGALIALVLVVAIAACSTIGAFTDLSSELRAEGFGDVRVTVGGGDPVVLLVTADAPSGTSTSTAIDQATEIVWTTFPRRFEALQLTVDGTTRRLDYAEIEDDLGARPAQLDETDLTDEVARLSLGLVLALIVGAVLLVLLAALIALVVTRRRRRRGVMGGPPPTGLTAWAPPGPIPPGGPPPPAGPPPQWIPPGGPPPAWAPPPGSPSGPGGVGPGPVPPAAGPPTPPSPPPSPEERREAAREARRLGRRPRGPRPPATQVPRGWDR